MMSATAASPSGQSWNEELAEFFRILQKPLVRYLIVCGCPPHEADDIAQDSFLAVRERWEHVRSLDQPKAYLFKVAVRRFWRVRKQQRPHLFITQDPGEHLMAFPDPADAFSTAEDRADLMAMIRQLPPRQRQVLWLRTAADFSETETAAILSLSVGTVKSQLHEARKKLTELARKSRGDDTAR